MYFQDRRDILNRSYIFFFFFQLNMKLLYSVTLYIEAVNVDYAKYQLLICHQYRMTSLIQRTRIKSRDLR